MTRTTERAELWLASEVEDLARMTSRCVSRNSRPTIEPEVGLTLRARNVVKDISGFFPLALRAHRPENQNDAQHDHRRTLGVIHTFRISNHTGKSIT